MKAKSDTHCRNLEHFKIHNQYPLLSSLVEIEETTPLNKWNTPLVVAYMSLPSQLTLKPYSFIVSISQVALLVTQFPHLCQILLFAFGLFLASTRPFEK